MTPAEHLRAARKLITPEGAWTQGAYAKDKQGLSVSPGSKNAVSYSIIGAGQLSICGGEMRIFLNFVNKFTEGNVIAWEDKPKRTQAEVISVLDKAIELAEAQS